MYCSTCGVALAQELSYCNYCGAKLGGARDEEVGDSREIRPGSLIFAMMATFIFGLVAIAMLMGMMKVVIGFSMVPLLAFSLLSFLILLMLEGVFIGLLVKPKHRAQQTGGAERLRGQATKEIDAAYARVLGEPVASVTEHTTRTFEPVYQERTSK